jgi:adenosine deaminase
MMDASGPGVLALKTLTPAQIQFLQMIPKAELHAHLNGSIPIATLKELASEYLGSSASSSKSIISNETIKLGIESLTTGPSLEKINDFFFLFPSIYALTSTPTALARATRAVLNTFLDGTTPQCQYLELRTTPRQTEAMDREQYLRVVLAEMKRYKREQVALIVSFDRRMDHDVLRDCIRIACKLKSEGERVVGVDLCGDPMAGKMNEFGPYFAQAKQVGLGVTMHIAEV